MFPGREPRAPPPIARPADQHDCRPLAPNCGDLFRRSRKRLPAIRTDRPYSAFVDQGHTLLLPSLQHRRRTVFRAAGDSVNAAKARPGSKPPCLSTFKNVRGWPLSVPFCALITPHIALRPPACRMASFSLPNRHDVAGLRRHGGVRRQRQRAGGRVAVGLCRAGVRVPVQVTRDQLYSTDERLYARRRARCAGR